MTTDQATPATTPQAPIICGLCESEVQQGEAYFTNRPVTYHEGCAATYEDGAIDHGLSWIVANNRRLFAEQDGATR